MLDQKLIRRGFERAAAGFDEHDFLHREIRERLLERLAAVRIEPRLVIDLGAGTGAATAALEKRFPAATIVPIDLTRAMLAAGGATRNALCADAAQLPLPDASADVVFSNLMLHHCPDPAAVLAEGRRVLRSPGLLLFTTFGPDSLLELGRAWATADRFSHISPFADMHNIGDSLVRAGFAEPVIDSQVLTITYGAVESLTTDLRNAGSSNATPDRNRGLTGRAAAQRLHDACRAQAGADGRIPITLDIVFGIAWAGEDRPRRSPGGPVEIPLERLGRRPR
ncbi:MAG: methyltransferase domain-containing protein [Gammaproteobacteria bacterium]|nr:methyltransferase domain-containing protein [Gammaproteobacteria bacterium]